MTKQDRIGIFSLYAAEGSVDKYKYVLLESIIDYFGKFVIVVNGNVSNEDLDKLNSYTSEIYLRPNIGYDIGAYKDTMLDYLGEEKWQDWKELVLINDTFYGPIFPWGNMFEVMEERKNDFWGLGEHVGGKNIAPHIQSYFMTFKQSVLSSQFFWDFWKAFQYPGNREEAINGFELIFTELLKKHGFVEDSYMRAFKSKFSLKYGQCAYLDNAYGLLHDIKFPIVKFRLLSPVYYEEAAKVLNYIKNASDYDLNLIYEHLDRLERQGDIRPFGERQLDKFYHTHEKTYIFGYGKFGKNVGKFFDKKSWKFESFVTTNGMPDDGVLSLGQLKLSEKDGMILALGDNNLREVYPNISKRFAPDQILMARIEMKDKAVI